MLPRSPETQRQSSMVAEVYVSTDIEADGPIPGPNSMLSFASVALTVDGKVLGDFEANLETLPNASPDPATMDWWQQQPEAWAQCRKNIRAPADALPDYRAWLLSLPGKPVFVGYPAAYDFMFVYWYLVRFAGDSPFSFAALDIKTLAMAALGTGYRDTCKCNMPREWFDAQLPHTHRALDDAREQGMLFCRIWRSMRQQ